MTLAELLRPRDGRWVRVEATRGMGGVQCGCCRETVFSGWSWFDSPAQSSAFLCDPCVEMIVDADEIA